MIAAQKRLPAWVGVVILVVGVLFLMPEIMTGRAQAADYRSNRYTQTVPGSPDIEKLLSQISKEVAGKVHDKMKKAKRKSEVAVVAAVPLSDLKRETEFGRLVGEYLLTDLAVRGLRVSELRMGRGISILPQTGEFFMSRNAGELAKVFPAPDYVVVSTFSNTRKTLILQGRLVERKSGLVQTAWRYSLPLNRELQGLFQPDEQPFVMAVKGFQQ